MGPGRRLTSSQKIPHSSNTLSGYPAEETEAEEQEQKQKTLIFFVSYKKKNQA